MVYSDAAAAAHHHHYHYQRDHTECQESEITNRIGCRPQAYVGLPYQIRHGCNPSEPKHAG